jgi:type II secretory pathway pseudopilin PulG
MGLRPRQIRGFTAFELLFVIVILATTVALLLPVLEAAKERDRSAACQSNLHRCAQALMMYTDDWDATLPSSAIVAANPSQAQVTEFLTGKGAYPMHAAKACTWPDFLSYYLSDNDTVYCPSDDPRTRVSYWWKYANDLVWRDSTLRRRKRSDYVYAADQIAFYEHAGWHTGDAAGIKNGVKINVAFMDTHASAIVVRNGPISYPPASDERSGTSSIRLGEPMYYDYDNQTSSYHPGVADYIDPRRYSDKF